MVNPNMRTTPVAISNGPTPSAQINSQYLSICDRNYLHCQLCGQTFFDMTCSNGHEFQHCNKTFLPIFLADGAKCWSLCNFHINDTTIDEWTQLRTLIKILGGCTCTFCGWHSLFSVCFFFFFFVCVYVTYSLLDFLLLFCCCVLYITDFYSTCCVFYYQFFIEQRFIVMILFAIFVYMHRKWIWAWRKNFIFLLFYSNTHMYAYSQENVLWQKETASIHPSTLFFFSYHHAKIITRFCLLSSTFVLC